LKNKKAPPPYVIRTMKGRKCFSCYHPNLCYEHSTSRVQNRTQQYNGCDRPRGVNRLVAQSSSSLIFSVPISPSKGSLHQKIIQLLFSS